MSSWSPATFPVVADYSLRPATDADFEAIHALRTEAYRDYVVRHYGTWDDVWQRDHLREAWPKRKRDVVVLGDVDVGYIDVRWTDEGLFVGNLVLASAQRGQGLGSRILGDLLARADAQGVASRLQVFHDNPAVALYERLGFVGVERTDTHLHMRREPQ